MSQGEQQDDLKLFAIVTLKVRLPSDKTIPELKAEIREHIVKGEFFIKSVDFKLQGEVKE
jgi:hypothetical protein